MTDTAGRRLLNKYLKASGALSQAALAKEIGVSAPSLYAWRLGESRPQPHYRKALARLGVAPEESWMTATEKEIARGRAA